MKRDFFKSGFFKVCLLVTFTAGLWGANCSASLVTMGMDTVFGASSVAPSSSTTPYSTVVYQDNGDGTVNLTISNPHLTGVESLSGVYLNFDDSKNVGSLTFTKVSSTGSFTDPTSIQKTKNNFQPDGDGLYDILINFDTGS